MLFYVDIVGTCNLRCPSCPVGSLPATGRPKGKMSRDLFNRILDKIGAEHPSTPSICLFNWGEPLLHPQLPQLIEDVRGRGWACILSSNMNTHRDLGPIVAAGPTYWRISISGADQQTYGRTHEKGQIDVVLRNMRALREQMDIHGKSIDVEVFYHLYRNNLNQELKAIHDLARELGFRATAMPAHLMPVENYLRLRDGKLGNTASGLLDEFLVHPTEMLDLAKTLAKDRTCEMLDSSLTINCDGSVDLCCASYEPEHRMVDDIFSVTLEELQARRNAASVCSECMDLGVNKTYEALHSSNPAFGDLLRPRLEQLDPSGLAASILGLEEAVPPS